jgi:hypothetical protein
MNPSRKGRIKPKPSRLKKDPLLFLWIVLNFFNCTKYKNVMIGSAESLV